MITVEQVSESLIEFSLETTNNFLFTIDAMGAVNDIAETNYLYIQEMVNQLNLMSVLTVINSSILVSILLIKLLRFVIKKFKGRK